MSTSSGKQFGLLIAYVLPGFIGLAGIAPLVPAVGQWLRPVGQVDLALGPPLYAVLGATALGLILSCFRWVVIDHVHEWTGITRPAWDDRELDGVLSGFDYVVQNHFRYYEFTGNTLLALLAAYALNRSLDTLPFLGVGTDLGMLIVATVLFAASRDALAKYYARTGRLVGGVVAEKAPRGKSMFNGNDHGGADKAEPKPESKPQENPKAPTTPAPSDTKQSQAEK
jgi:hypothetical protein